MHPNVHSSITYNSQDMEAIYIFIKGILLGHKTDKENEQVVAGGRRTEEEKNR